jgi:hypothetical protein
MPSIDLNDTYLLRELPDGCGVHMHDGDYIVTYREREAAVHIDDATVELLVEIAEGLVAEEEEDESN